MSWHGNSAAPPQQGGQVTVDIVTAGVIVSQTVTFPVPFASTPTVVVTPNTTLPDSRHATCGGATPEGFNLYTVNMASTADVVVNWVAIA